MLLQLVAQSHAVWFAAVQPIVGIESAVGAGTINNTIIKITSEVTRGLIVAWVIISPSCTASVDKTGMITFVIFENFFSFFSLN